VLVYELFKINNMIELFIFGLLQIKIFLLKKYFILF